MKTWWKSLLCVALPLFLSGCVEPYAPPVLEQAPNYLVVEGFLTNDQPARIRLSRVTRLSETPELTGEMGATVSIQSSEGDVYPLAEETNGYYISPQADLNTALQYRLHINTERGGEYVSEYVSMRDTPPIDSVSWDYQEDGVHISVTTHDPLNNTRFYRWEFEETWEYNVPYTSYFQYNDSVFVTRDPVLPTRCWQQEQSSALLINTSAKLESDIIFKQPLTVVPIRSPKINRRYSILVKQYALSREAYEYYRQMLQNTEQMGSIFDPQPTELWGNIYSVNTADEPVIGFFSAGSVQEKRIFIHNRDLPDWTNITSCATTEVPLAEANSYFKRSDYIPLTVDTYSGTVTAVHSYDCVDCSRKANPEMPSYWE